VHKGVFHSRILSPGPQKAKLDTGAALPYAEKVRRSAIKSLCIIIPCFNESEGLGQLGEALARLPLQAYSVSWIFVDDGSTDTTHEQLLRLAAKLGNARVLRHATNRNLGAALRTGLENLPDCDYVAYLDSDCTYDPGILLPLVKKLEEGADMATASPYHPRGKVAGVPGWRLFLSKGLSLLYRLRTGAKIHTFTAMVRAQKREVALRTCSERDDFSFVSAVMLKALSLGYKVEEVPATLEARRFGFSKMKVLRTIRRQLFLLARGS
jgi:dolichol-phosphate mannosyltransferase